MEKFRKQFETVGRKPKEKTYGIDIRPLALVIAFAQPWASSLECNG